MPTQTKGETKTEGGYYFFSMLEEKLRQTNGWVNADQSPPPKPVPKHLGQGDGRAELVLCSLTQHCMHQGAQRAGASGAHVPLCPIGDGGQLPSPWCSAWHSRHMAALPCCSPLLAAAAGTRWHLGHGKPCWGMEGWRRALLQRTGGGSWVRASTVPS